MSEAKSERAVRKALLQAHAEVERIEVAQRVAQVREAITPRALLHQVLPFSFGNSAGDSHGYSQQGSGAGFNFSNAFSQIGSVYERYPVLWSAAASLFVGRGRIGKVVKVLGLVLAARKALRLGRSRRRQY